MRAVLQRVSNASVSVDGIVLGRIGVGLVLFVAIKHDDTDEDIEYLTEKIINMRVFGNLEGRFDRSLIDVEGDLLVISQFTLYADTRKGRRPSFTNSATAAEAEPRFNKLLQRLSEHNITVETGRFGGMMEVSLVNDGPVTIILDSGDRHKARK